MKLKTVIRSIVIGCFFISLTGCATVTRLFPAKVFPETDIVIISKSPELGRFMYFMEKGFFTDKAKRWQWMSQKEWLKKQREFQMKRKKTLEKGSI